MTLESKLLRDSQPSFLEPWFEKWANRGIIQKSNLKRFGEFRKSVSLLGFAILKRRSCCSILMGLNLQQKKSPDTATFSSDIKLALWLL
jgi:hypothetical protein